MFEAYCGVCGIYLFTSYSFNGFISTSKDIELLNKNILNEFKDKSPKDKFSKTTGHIICESCQPTARHHPDWAKRKNYIIKKRKDKNGSK